MKGNNKDFYTYVTNRIQTTESMGRLFNGAEDQVTNNTDKAVDKNF